MTDTSGSSTELIAGFALRRRIGDAVWEAVQPELGRRVALRLLEPDTPFDASAWPHRPGVPALYAVVPAPEGTYVATRYVPDARSLAELRGARAGRRRRWLDAAAVTLDGTVHGRLTEHDILVAGDGQVFVTGFGSSRGADDAAALTRMRAPERRRRRVAPVVAAGAAAVTAVVLLTHGDSARPAPPVTAGATAYGSDLADGAFSTIDCQGDAPSGDALPCTLMQTSLPGRRLDADGRGLVRGWSVRGATGRISLLVLRRRDGGWYAYNRSTAVTVGHPGTATLIPADMSVPKGARFGIELQPGSGVGVRRGVRGAATVKLDGLVRHEPRPVVTADGTGNELLLRVDLVPGFVRG